MSVEENNKALMRKFFEEIWSKGNVAAVDEFLAPEFVVHNMLPGKEAGKEDYKRAVAEQHAASSDFHVSIEEQIAEGDKVVTRHIDSGTHDQAEFEGFAPSGARITIENITLNRVAEGKIVEERNAADISPLWQGRMEQERIERERIAQELQVARSIQQASLPEEVPTLTGWEIAPLYRPAREVGGDFYDFHLLFPPPL